MGFNLLSSSGQKYTFTGTSWTFILNLAEIYGWKGQGTQKPQNYRLLIKWHGGYDTNEKQIVNKEDSSNLANALIKACADPNLQKQVTLLAKNIQIAIEKAIGQPLGYSIANDVDINIIKQFIDFCKKGSFQIT
jgi:hypothetical protein